MSDRNVSTGDETAKYHALDHDIFEATTKIRAAIEQARDCLDELEATPTPDVASKLRFALAQIEIHRAEIRKLIVGTVLCGDCADARGAWEPVTPLDLARYEAGIAPLHCCDEDGNPVPLPATLHSGCAS